MNYSIFWADEALAAAATYLTEDREELLRVFAAADTLSIDPRPNDAFAWGIDRYRMRVGRYRMIYEVADEMVTVQVAHLNRGAN